jgi:hypothetical protein
MSLAALSIVVIPPLSMEATTPPSLGCCGHPLEAQRFPHRLLQADVEGVVQRSQGQPDAGAAPEGGVGGGVTDLFQERKTVGRRHEGASK